MGLDLYLATVGKANGMLIVEYLAIVPAALVLCLVCSWINRRRAKRNG